MIKIHFTDEIKESLKFFNDYMYDIVHSNIYYLESLRIFKKTFKMSNEENTIIIEENIFSNKKEEKITREYEVTFEGIKEFNKIKIKEIENDKEIIWRTGKLLRVLFSTLEIEVSDNHISTLVDIITPASVFKNYIEDNKLKINIGKEFKRSYSTSNYIKVTGHLGNSCMNDNSSVGEFFYILSDNLSILTIEDESRKIYGRALLWDTTKGKYLDRVYLAYPEYLFSFIYYIVKYYNIKYFYYQPIEYENYFLRYKINNIIRKSLEVIKKKKEVNYNYNIYTDSFVFYEEREKEIILHRYKRDEEERDKNINYSNKINYIIYNILFRNTEVSIYVPSRKLVNIEYVISSSKQKNLIEIDKKYPSIKTLYKVFFPSILIESVKGYGFEVECYIINSFNYKYIIINEDKKIKDKIYEKYEEEIDIIIEKIFKNEIYNIEESVILKKEKNKNYYKDRNNHIYDTIPILFNNEELYKNIRELREEEIREIKNFLENIKRNTNTLYDNIYLIYERNKNGKKKYSLIYTTDINLFLKRNKDIELVDNLNKFIIDENVTEKYFQI